jgi:hypothetical protein
MHVIQLPKILNNDRILFMSIDSYKLWQQENSQAKDTSNKQQARSNKHGMIMHGKMDNHSLNHPKISHSSSKMMMRRMKKG